MSAKDIKEDLINQLDLKGMYHSFYRDLVDTYCTLYNANRELKKDLKKRGTIVSVTTGNGFTQLKENVSMSEIRKNTNQMQSILRDLDLQKPTINDSDDDYF